MILKDSGIRREFISGAVRDGAEGKGRCDLLPLDAVNLILPGMGGMISTLEDFQRSGDLSYLLDTINLAIEEMYDDDPFTAMIEVSKQYEDGATKYAVRNWEKGMPCHIYVDSAIRHYLKWRRGDEDEPHDRACLWNLLGLWWTFVNLPDMNDLPYEEDEE